MGIEPQCQVVVEGWGWGGRGQNEVERERKNEREIERGRKVEVYCKRGVKDMQHGKECGRGKE